MESSVDFVDCNVKGSFKGYKKHSSYFHEIIHKLNMLTIFNNIIAKSVPLDANKFNALHL